MRERVEAVKFSTLQWLMYDPRLSSAIYNQMLTRILQGCLHRYRCSDSWCVALVDVDFLYSNMGMHGLGVLQCLFGSLAVRQGSHASGLFISFVLYKTPHLFRLQNYTLHLELTIATVFHKHDHQCLWLSKKRGPRQMLCWASRGRISTYTSPR